MKRKTKIETRYQNQRYQLRAALSYLEFLLHLGVAMTSSERAEVERFVARTRREAGFRS